MIHHHESRSCRNLDSQFTDERHVHVYQQNANGLSKASQINTSHMIIKNPVYTHTLLDET